MTSTIKIKRSGISGSPAALAQGELAYSYLTGNQSNGGDRLYIGTGTETLGEAANIEVIGGKYFTDKLDHVPGTLTAESAIIVDSSSKIDILNVDNITINGNEISSTNSDGNISLNPNGTGSVDVNSAKITSLATPTVDTDAATKKYVDDQFAGDAVIFTIAADSGPSDTIKGQETFTISGDTGITTSVSNNQITVDLDDTTVSPGTYGSTTAIPSITVDQQGRLTNVTTVDVATTLTISDDALNTDIVNLLNDTLTFSEGEGINILIANNSVTVSGENASDTNKGIASFSSTNFTVSSGDVSTNDLTLGSDSGTAAATLGETMTIAGTDAQGIDTSATGTTVTITAKNASTSQKGVASFSSTNFTVSSGAVSTNDFTLGSTSLTLGESTTTIAGLTQVDIDNIRILDNKIASTNTNGNIVLDPNGSGTVDVNNSRITSVSDPTSAQDAATKAYVDTVAEGLSAKPAVRVATDSNLDATYDNGTLGVGATLTANANTAFPTIDGISAYSIYDGVLVKDQTNAAENGRYFVSVIGDGSTPWELTRCPACDEADEIPSMYIFVQEGNVYGSTGWVALVSNTSFTVGTDDIDFVQFSGAGTYTAGDGLDLSGTVFSVNVDDDGIEINADTLRLKDTTVAAGSYGSTTEIPTFTVDSKGRLTAANTVAVATTLNIADDNANIDVVNLLNDTLTFSEGEGVNVIVSNNAITISGENASDTNKGIASFNSTHFTVSSGAVSANDLTLGSDSGTAAATLGETMTIAGTDAQGIDTSATGTTVTITAKDATSSQKGVASFDATNFTVTSGDVVIAEVDGGSY